MKSGWYTGIDIGGTNIKIAFIDYEGNILFKWCVPTDTSNMGKNIVSSIVLSIEQMLITQKIDKREIIGIGVGIPGLLEIESGRVILSANLGWKNYFLKDRLQDKIGVPVVLNNDANIATIGEMWKGSGQEEVNVILITLGTGIGCGIIVEGCVIKGENGFAGEIGHTTSILEDGDLCNCGNKGCLETIASSIGIVNQAMKEINNERNSLLTKELNKKGFLTAEDVFLAAEKKDDLAIRVINKACKHLGLVIANLAMTLNPSKVIIGGGMSMAGDILLKPLQKYFGKFAHPYVKNNTQLVIASLGNDAGIIGAGWMARELHRAKVV